jgi:hypothetical protein
MLSRRTRAHRLSQYLPIRTQQGGGVARVLSLHERTVGLGVHVATIVSAVATAPLHILRIWRRRRATVLPRARVSGNNAHSEACVGRLSVPSDMCDEMCNPAGGLSPFNAQHVQCVAEMQVQYSASVLVGGHRALCNAIMRIYNPSLRRSAPNWTRALQTFNSSRRLFACYRDDTCVKCNHTWE